jgi:hypothetical protein
MKHNFWRVLALGVLATGLIFLLGGRFNFISTTLGTTLLLLLLTERPHWAAPAIDRCAWAAVFGIVLLLAAGRLLEPVWAALDFPPTREVLVSWVLLSLPGWWAGRSPASED